jgi:hypothetical protein
LEALVGFCSGLGLGLEAGRTVGLRVGPIKGLVGLAVASGGSGREGVTVGLEVGGAVGGAVGGTVGGKVGRSVGMVVDVDVGATVACGAEVAVGPQESNNHTNKSGRALRAFPLNIRFSLNAWHHNPV